MYFSFMQLKYLWPSAATIIGLLWSLYNCQLMVEGNPWGLIWSVISSHLDFVDGTLARWLDACSEFGNFLDKTADKIRHAAQSYVAIILFGTVPTWIFWALIIRDVLIDYIRYMLILLRVCMKVKIPFKHSSSFLAKLKTYVLPYSLLLLILGTDRFEVPYLKDSANLRNAVHNAGYLCIMLTVAMSYYTFFTFLITIGDKRYTTGKLESKTKKRV